MRVVLDRYGPVTERCKTTCREEYRTHKENRKGVLGAGYPQRTIFKLATASCILLNLSKPAPYRTGTSFCANLYGTPPSAPPAPTPPVSTSLTSPCPILSVCRASDNPGRFTTGSFRNYRQSDPLRVEPQTARSPVGDYHRRVKRSLSSAPDPSAAATEYDSTRTTQMCSMFEQMQGTAVAHNTGATR